MTSGIQQTTVQCHNKMMQIQPPDNWIKTPDTESTQGNQPRRVKPADSVINEFGSGFESLVQNAIQSDTHNIDAVAAAKKALTDGTLDTPQTHQQTAQNLLCFGI